MDKFYYNSPIGILEIVYFKDILYSLKITDKLSISDIKKDFPKNIQLQLDEYFIGKRKNFDINIKPHGTAFQKQVWKELLKIPYGTKKCYSEIAIKIGNPNAQRAVGLACNKNPIMIIIPCHRVISKSGNLGGFVYDTHIKEKLLKIESCV